MIAYIPARGGSKRVPKKNIRSIGGKPAILHVIDALSRVSELKGICVSSENEEILSLVRKDGRSTILKPRDPFLSEDHASFLDLIQQDLPRFTNHFKDDDVMIVLATSVLVEPAHYRQALNLFFENAKGLVIGMSPYSHSPFLAFRGRPNVSLVSLFPDMYVKPTKDLPSSYYDAGCFYLFNVVQFKGLTKMIDLSPIRGIVLPSKIGIDVDTESDWKDLVNSYEELKSN